MIIVNVEVPIIGAEFDFQFDKDVPMWVVQEEITELICQQQQFQFEGQKYRLLLWDKNRHFKIRLCDSAEENGLETGSELLLA